MERANHTILIIMLLGFMCSVNASERASIYQAFIGDDMGAWKTLIDQMQDENSLNKERREELLNYQYGYIAWCIGMKKKDEAKEYLLLAEDNLAALEKSGYDSSWANAYRSAFYGFHIGLNFIEAPVLGPKSLKCAERSVELDKRNWFAYLQLANAKYYAPKMFGGSKQEALKSYLVALSVMEKNSELIAKNWNYLNLLVILAQAFEDIEAYDRAESYYQKILSIEPGFKWVRDELYPNLQKKINKE